MPLKLLWPLLPIMIFGGCATTPHLNPEFPYGMPEPQAGQRIHLPTGQELTEEAFLTAATDSRIVYAGETHDNPAAHRVQLELLRTMHERWPGRIALGMEMFTRDQQAVLEAWRLGEMSEKEFLRQSQWDRAWGFDWRLYRHLLLFARDQGIPVIGLNAEKDLVKAVGQTPLEELGAPLRQRLPEMDLDDPYHKALTEAVFDAHTGGKAMKDGFIRVQTLWDETMADSIARYLKSPNGQGRKMLVIAGRRHISYGTGIPRRVHRRLPTSYTLVGIEEHRLPQDVQHKQMMEVAPVSLPMPAYDYLAWVDYDQLPPQGVKLGIRLDPQSLKVTEVIAARPAAAAGIQVDDVLLQLDDVVLQEFFDLRYELKQRKAGETAVVIVRRGQETLKMEVTFTPSVPTPKP